MKKYRFKLSRNARKQLSKLAVVMQRRIILKLEEYESLEHPLKKAKKMKGERNRLIFRVGDYRAVCTTKDENTIVILLVLKIGHRREVYE